MREITLGIELETILRLFRVLENGDEIVTNGTFTVDAAAQLQGKNSMMNKDKGAIEAETTSNENGITPTISSKF